MSELNEIANAALNYANQTTALGAYPNSTSTYSFNSFENDAFTQTATETTIQHSEGSFANGSFSYGCVAYFDQVSSRSTFTVAAGQSVNGGGTFTAIDTSMLSNANTLGGPTQDSSSVGGTDSVALAGNLSFSAWSASTYTQTGNTSYTTQYWGTNSNNCLSLSCWTFNQTDSANATQTSAQQGNSLATAAGTFGISSTLDQSTSDIGMQDEYESAYGNGGETLTAYQSFSSTGTQTAAANDTVALLGSYSGGSYALSSANYTSQANSTATAQSNGLSLQTAQASDTYMSSVSALITLTDGGGDYSGSAGATGSVPDGQSLTVNALSTYSLNQSQSQSASSYEQGTYSGGTLSLSSVSYNGNGSSQQTYQTGSLMTAVASDSGDVSWVGTVAARFFGNGTSTAGGTLTAVTTQVTAATGTATSDSDFNAYYGGSYNGSQFSFGSYSLDQSGTNQSGSLATTVTTARGTMTFSGSVVGSLGLGGGAGHGIGGLGGGGGAPSTFTDSGTETFTSIDTYSVGQSALSSYAVHEEGTVSNGSYALSLYSETLQSTATATISDSSLQTSMEIGSGYTLTATLQSSNTSNSNQSTSFFESGSWQSSTGFSLSSVLYMESMASISSGSASSNQTVNFGSMSLNSATLAEVDSASSAQTHNLYESGIYSVGSYALGSYCLNDTATSATGATKNEATSTSNFSETDSTSFVDAVHAEGSYANGSFSFGTFSHNATSLTSHTLDRHAPNVGDGLGARLSRAGKKCCSASPSTQHPDVTKFFIPSPLALLSSRRESALRL